jgi:hypothetical protein
MRFSNEKIDKEKLINELYNVNNKKIKRKQNDCLRTIINSGSKTTTNINKLLQHSHSLLYNSITSKELNVHKQRIPKHHKLPIRNNQQQHKTIIKLRRGHYTTDSIENEVNQLSKQFIMINTLDISTKHKHSLDMNDNYNGSSSYMSYVNLSNLKESVCNKGDNCLNEIHYSNNLPQLKHISQSYTTKHKFHRNKQNMLNTIMNKEILTYNLSKQKLRNKSTTQKIKKFYNQKKRRGYSSLLNLDNNKYGTITIRKTNIHSYNERTPFKLRSYS